MNTKLYGGCPIIFQDKEFAWVWNGVIKKNPCTNFFKAGTRAFGCSGITKVIATIPPNRIIIHQMGQKSDVGQIRDLTFNLFYLFPFFLVIAFSFIDSFLFQHNVSLYIKSV
ncbi:hypothetical protein [Peribacillus butanolivorans]|uniref:hypothetical protein n=1 Tax=Peribacillus butanolivorans TaxID=421767 RepID=UPI0036DE1BBB